MIVGLVLSAFPSYSETFFRNKIRFLIEAGIKVIVFANNSKNTKAEHNFVEGFSWNGGLLSRSRQITIALIRILLSPAKALTLYKLNKQSGYSKKENYLSLLSSAHILKFKLDWLHFGFATTTLGRENLAKAIGTRMAVSIRGYDIGVYPIKHQGCYCLLWERLDKLHYISDDLLSLAKIEGFKCGTSHQKITPAVDVTLFQGTSRSAFSAPLKIVTVARLHWIKGLDYTLEALKLLKTNGINFEFTVIGDGNDYERLIYASYQLGIKDDVHFVGMKTPQEIKQILKESDIYLQYSIHEGFCNALIEAQAMGLLCIVSDGGALPENILHEKTGWIVPKRNPHALAKQIMKIIDFPENKLRQISGSAIDRVKREFTLQKQKSEFIKFYQ